jgi:ADP-ribose pyrophosphatase YjhB (NUDIX family)
MTMRPAPQFGTPPTDRAAQPRPGAYGLLLDGGHTRHVLLVRWRDRLFLPGGGVRPAETHEQALRREFAEETGQHVTAMALVGWARQFVRDAGGRHWNKHCSFWLATTEPARGDQPEHDHTALWVPLPTALRELHEEASRWALRRAAGNDPSATAQPC